jgi:2-oxoglutarate ferredoxin oxidoreductase subunit alpha
VAALQDRLRLKISQHFREIEWVVPYALEEAKVVIIAYGSVARAARRAVRLARDQGLPAGLLTLISLFPFPRGPVMEAVSQTSLILVPELNWGQISREVKRVMGGQGQVLTLNKVDGSQITPEEILIKIRENL